METPSVVDARFILLHLNEAHIMSGRVFYVDARNGSDNNSGTSVSQAWKSIAHVNAQQFQPGDQILLKRGDVYGTGLYLKNSGTAEAPIKIGAYGVGANPRFDGSAELVHAKWTETSPGSHVWKTAVAAQGGEDPGRIKFNGVNGHIEAAHAGAVTKPGDWSWDSGVLSVYSATNPSSAFRSVALQVDNRMVHISAENVVLQNIDVTMARYGFMITKSHVTLENCNAFSNTMNGFTINGSTGVTLRGGSSFDNGRDGEGSSTMHLGHGVLITGGSNKNLVEGMKLYANAEDGVQFGPSTMNGNIIRNNEIFNNREDGVDIKSVGNQSFIGNNISGNTELGININAGQFTTNFVDAGTITLTGNYISSSDAQALETGKYGAVISSNNTYVGANSSTISLWAANRTSTFSHDTFIDGGLKSTMSVEVTAGSNHVFEDSTFIMRNPGKALMIGGSADNVTLKNNTFYSEGAFLVRFNEGKTINSDYNHYYRGDSAGGWFQVSTATGWKTYGSADLQKYGTAWGIDQHSTVGRPVAASEGTDALVGSTGADNLNGKGGNDVLFGKAGADILNGGLGTDTLIGDAGSDVFVFNTALNATTNVDRIRDFNVTDDSIYLDNAFFKTVGTGTTAQPLTLNADMFTIGTKALDAEDRIIYDNANGYLYYDADGTGQSKPILFADLPENLKLTASDFFVI
jgi:Ca2+-binding RTX toxin-like protein